MSIPTEIKSKLFSLEHIYWELQKTEPLVVTGLSNVTKAKFRLEPDWALSLDAIDGNSPVAAFMSIGSNERQLTKDAVLQAGANFGIPAAYAKRVPAHFIEQLLNYHYGAGMGSTEFNLITVKGNVSAFVKPTINPFQNTLLLDRVIDGINGRFGDTEILVDYKFVNNLSRTDVRLILPEFEHIISGTQMKDVPVGAEDTWSGGIHLTNSVIGKTQTGVDAYLFRWWCTNGATEEFDEVGKWSRRAQHDLEVYDWARESVDDILGGLESKFDDVQRLTSLKTEGNTGEIVKEIFDEYKIPKSQQLDVAETLFGEPVLDMYTIMNAITKTANDPEIDPARADVLMRIGGSIPSHSFDTIKAKVWREGHSAEPNANNPYEPHKDN